MCEEIKRKNLRNFLINFFKLKKNFQGEISVSNINEWDSISHMDLILELEKKFKKNLKKKSHLLTSESKIYNFIK